MNKFITEFKKMDHSILELTTAGIKFSFFVSLISLFTLITYNFVYAIPTIYYIGISLFKTSLFFMVGFIICGIAFSKIKKELKN